MSSCDIYEGRKCDQRPCYIGQKSERSCVLHPNTYLYTVDIMSIMQHRCYSLLCCLWQTGTEVNRIIVARESDLVCELREIVNILFYYKMTNEVWSMYVDSMYMIEKYVLYYYR